MNRKVLFVLGIFLVGLMGAVEASSSSTLVNFTVNPNNGSDDEAFDCVVGDLDVDDVGYDWVSLDWENCDDERFLYNLIFVDRILVGQTFDEFFNVTDLVEDSRYEFSVLSISDESEEGLWVSVFGRTLEEGDEENRGSEGKNGMSSDEIPNFFVGGSSLGYESVVYLDDYVAREDGFDYWMLFVWGLILLIFVLLILIFREVR